MPIAAAHRNCEVPANSRLEWVSAVTTPVLRGSNDEAIAPNRRSKQESTMKTKISHVAPWLAAAAIGGALVFAPVASAATPSPKPGPHAAPSSPPGTSQYGSGEDPLVPSGTWAPGDIVPYDPYIKNPGGGVDQAS